MCWQVFQWDQDVWQPWLWPVHCSKVWGFTNNHTLLWLLTSLLSVLALHVPRCSQSSPSDSGKTQRWNKLHYCLWSNFQELCFKSGLWVGNRALNKERGANSVFPQCFHTLTDLTWFFRGENQALPSHFTDEQLEPRYQGVKGCANHSWR